MFQHVELRNLDLKAINISKITDIYDTVSTCLMKTSWYKFDRIKTRSNISEIFLKGQDVFHDWHDIEIPF